MYADMKRELRGPLIPVRQAETCFRTMRMRSLCAKPGSMNVVALRKPLSHVIAQYMQCKYDPVHNPDTNKSNQSHYQDPSCTSLGCRMWGRKGKTSDREGFKLWVTFFASSDWSPQDGHWGCYNPRNMQTRILSCSDDEATGNSHGAGTNEPKLAVALQSLQEATAVGLVEQYHVSICMFIGIAVQAANAKAQAGSLGITAPRMPNGCRCASNVVLEMTHEDHSLPPHKPKDMGLDNDPELVAAIESITKLDEMLHHVATKEFQHMVRRFNASTFEATGSYVC